MLYEVSDDKCRNLGRIILDAKPLTFSVFYFFFLTKKSNKKSQGCERKGYKLIFAGRKKKNSPHQSCGGKSRMAQTVFSSKDRPPNTTFMRFSCEPITIPDCF